jgi:hypothetical protein
MSKLQELHDLLRDETKWPEGFKWDYALNSNCALGLALKSGIMPSSYIGPYAFDLTQRDWDRIFQTPLGNRYRFNEDNWAKVQPSTVALRIKRHLKAQAA